MSKHKSDKTLSKFLAVMLRHQTEQFGLQLDEQGFAPIALVWEQVVAKFGNRYSYDDLERIVESAGKKRYEIVEQRIRALYGHSTSQDIQYPTTIPPQQLYHGTNPTAAKKIRKTGLKAMQRQYVHLTTNIETALIVAKRRTHHPILLTIRALEAHDAGVVFYQADAEQYLVDAVPPIFINFPQA